MTHEQEINRKETSVKVLESMLSEQKEYYKNQPPKDLNRRFEYDLKIMALVEGIEALRQVKQDGIYLPILNGLTPTISSCTAKVYEEIGELMQLLGKGQRQSGELVEQLNNRSEWVRRTVEEALDGAQSLVTLVCTLLDEPGDIEIAMERHIEKLRGKGYLK